MLKLQFRISFIESNFFSELTETKWNGEAVGGCEGQKKEADRHQPLHHQQQTSTTRTENQMKISKVRTKIILPS